MTLCREHILGLSAKLSFAESWLSANLSFAERWLSAKKFFFKPPQPHNLFYFFFKKNSLPRVALGKEVYGTTVTGGLPLQR